MGPRLSLLKAYTTLLQMQSCGLSMTLHGSFALPTIQCLKPPQVQQYLDEICYLTFHS
jgi:hypothetical protein